MIGSLSGIVAAVGEDTALIDVGGVGYVVQVFGGLWPGIADAGWMAYVRMPAAIGEIGSCLWLLAFGARPGLQRSSTD